MSRPYLHKTLEELVSLETLKKVIDEHANLAITDEYGVILYVNDSFCEMSGFTREELVGKTHRKVNADYHPPEFFRAMWETIKSGRVWRGEIRNRAKDGTLFWSASTIVPIEGTAERPLRYVALRTDITDRKRIEELYIQANNRLEQRVAERTAQLEREISHVILLGEIATAANFSRSPQDAISSALQLISRHLSAPLAHACFLSKDRPGELLREHLWWPAESEAFQGCREQLQAVKSLADLDLGGEVLTGGRAFWVAHAQNVLKDSSAARTGCDSCELCQGSAIALPLLVGTETVAVIHFFLRSKETPDSTTLSILSQIGTQLGRVVERQRNAAMMAEQNLQILHSARMAAVGEMSASVAHEVNNPLTTLIGWNRRLQDLANGHILDPVSVQAIVANIDKMAQRISTTIKGMRSLARDSGKDPQVLVPIRTIIDETLGVCAERFRANAVELRIEAVPEHLKVSCRPNQISQVILNLLVNALDAVEGQASAWVSVSVREEASWLDILVTDCGKGIPPEIQQKILQPFFTTKAPGKGTGLGLSISQGIMETHQGKLFVDADCPNTRFVARLPRR